MKSVTCSSDAVYGAWTFLTLARFSVQTGHDAPRKTNFFFLKCSRITLHTWSTNGLHMLRAFCWLLRETPDRQHTSRRMNSDRIRRKSTHFRRGQASSSRLPKIKTLFLLKCSVFPPMWTCFHGQDSGLDKLALSSSPRFVTGFIGFFLDDCATSPWRRKYHVLIFATLILDHRNAVVTHKIANRPSAARFSRNPPPPMRLSACSHQ